MNCEWTRNFQSNQNVTLIVNVRIQKIELKRIENSVIITDKVSMK